MRGWAVRAAASLDSLVGLEALLDQLDPDPKNRGDQFERLCKWYLTSAPEYQGRFKRDVSGHDVLGSGAKPPGQAVPPDTKVEGFSWAKKVQKQRRGIAVRAGFKGGPEALTARASGTVKVSGRFPYKLWSRTMDVDSGDFSNHSLKLTIRKRENALKVRKELRRGKRRVSAKLRVRLSDDAGNFKTRDYRVKLRLANS